MRLNWVPAAPPTPTTGGAGGRRVGAGRAATGAGAGAAGAAVGAGADGGVTRSAIRPRRLTPHCSDPSVVTGAPASGRVAMGCAGRLPRMPMVASTANGPPTLRAPPVTEPAKSDFP